MAIRIYVAGPLFSTHERKYLEQIAAALEAAGFATFLPHRDAGLLTPESLTVESMRAMFQDDILALQGCDACVALLTGPDQDSGTSAELGYMYAVGKPCFGITDDRRFLNNMIWGICKDGERIYAHVEGLVAAVKAYYLDE